MAIKGSMMKAGSARTVRDVNVGQEWDEKLCTLDGIISSGDVQRRLPVLVTSIHVCLMPQ